MIFGAVSPYWGQDVIGFFVLLGRRCGQLMRGELAWDQLAADEIQILVLSLIAIAASCVAPFLVLRRITMIANSLSHTILIGILVAYALVGTLDLRALCLGAVVAALFTVSLMELLQTLFRLSEDAAMGLVFTSLFALGIMGVSLYFRDLHLGLETVMGNVDALCLHDAWVAALLCCVNIFAVAFWYHSLKLTNFDALLAKTLGISVVNMHILLLILTAVTMVGAMRAVGVVLILAFLVIPYLTARLMCHRLPVLLVSTALIGVGSSWLGVALSRHFLTLWDFPLSTGGIVVGVMVMGYFLAFAVRSVYTAVTLKVTCQ